MERQREINNRRKATVMLVDDTPANLRVLQEILYHSGYRVVAFPDGGSALKAAAKRPPDIILLDILMPGMDGFEVCRRLKADPVLSKIPVLFISALSEQIDKVRAFAAGGVDYVTKPFEEKEVLARVNAHINLYRFSRDLETMVEERTRELAVANERLRTHEAMLQSVFEGIPEPLLLVDRDMRVKLFNQAASRYYKAIGTALMAGGRLCSKNREANPAPCEDCEISEIVAKGERSVCERRGIANPDRIEQIFVYPIEENGRKTGDAVIRIADITEARRLSEEMAQADKLIALGTIAAGVAHEINNPAHVILLNTPILSDVCENIQPILDDFFDSNGDFLIGKALYSQLREDIPALIADIESSAERIKRIVAVLKDYSAKNESLALAPLNINKAVENAVLLMGHRIKRSANRFEVSYGNNLPLLNADQHKLEQVFVNLIANALEALPGNTSAVSIETLYDSERTQVVIAVRDGGIGISPHILSRIMDPFFTTKRAMGGTGLGLSIVQRIVDLHKGTMEIESEEGAGSIFRVRLPGAGTVGKAVSLPLGDNDHRGAL